MLFLVVIIVVALAVVTFTLDEIRGNIVFDVSAWYETDFGSVSKIRFIFINSIKSQPSAEGPLYNHFLLPFLVPIDGSTT